MPEQTARPRQVAVLPFRRTGCDVEVLLVTSRETRRCIVPKGWPMPGKQDHKAAAQEALEEAGVKGKVSKTPLGSYEAWKRLPQHFVLVMVEVYALEVTEELDTWKEKGQRERLWAPVQAAAALIDEPGLARIVADFAPARPLQ